LMESPFQDGATAIPSTSTSSCLSGCPGGVAGAGSVSRSFCLPTVMLSSRMSQYSMSFSQSPNSMYVARPFFCAQLDISVCDGSSPWNTPSNVSSIISSNFTTERRPHPTLEYMTVASFMANSENRCLLTGLTTTVLVLRSALRS
jgi:hypothetical protein